MGLIEYALIVLVDAAAAAAAAARCLCSAFVGEMHLSLPPLESL